MKAVTAHAHGATVIKVAHRLEALEGCTRILVLESGLPKECAPPSVLLEDPSSLLSRMVAAAGGDPRVLRLKLTQAEMEGGDRETRMGARGAQEGDWGVP